MLARVLSHVKSEPLIRREKFAAHVAGELEEVDVFLFPMLVVHSLGWKPSLTHVTRIDTKKMGNITDEEQIC